MTAIKQLNNTHLQVMHYIAVHSPTYILGMSREDDPPETAEYADTANAVTSELVALGFLEDISAKNLEALRSLEENRKRKHRIFIITPNGQLFFDGQASPVIN